MSPHAAASHVTPPVAPGLGTALERIARALHHADLTATTVVILAEDCTIEEVAERIGARAGYDVSPRDVRSWLADHGVPLCTAVPDGRSSCEQPGREVRRGVIRCARCER